MCRTKHEKGCCKDLKNLNEVKDSSIKLDKRIIRWAVIALLFLAVLYITFKTGNSNASGAAVQSAASTIKSAAAPTMVGGC